MKLRSRTYTAVPRPFHLTILLSLALSLTADSRTSGVAEPTKQNIAASYAKLPLRFEDTRGQKDAQVQFISRGAGYGLFLTQTEAVLSLHQTLEAKPVKPTTVRMKVLGASPSAAVVGMDELPAKSNYFIGNDPHKWRTNIPAYSRVHYADVYPGVDLVYYGNQRQLEYDFVVAPGGDP